MSGTLPKRLFSETPELVGVAISRCRISGTLPTATAAQSQPLQLLAVILCVQTFYESEDCLCGQASDLSLSGTLPGSYLDAKNLILARNYISGDTKVQNYITFIQYVAS